MFNNKIFIILICISVCIILLYDKYEQFDTDTNLFFKPIDNIFLGDNYYNYELNYPEIKQQTKSLGEITFNSYLYSKPIEQKIICTSHKNRADCWKDNVNNCQWVYKINNNSYCDVAPTWLL